MPPTAPPPAVPSGPASGPLLGAAHVLRPAELVPGARVVLRHRLPDGSAADVLGEVVVADGDALVVATRRGEVRVARADLLAGKAVPPAPQRRAHPARAVGVEDLERTMAEHWRPLERVDLGGWRLRAADGFTGRANSALAVGDPGTGLDAAVEEVRRFYAARDLPALVAVPADPDADTPLLAVLRGRGWTVRTPTAVLTAATSALPRAADAVLPPGYAVVRAAEPDAAWLAAYHYRGGPQVPPAGRAVLVSADAQVFLRVLAPDGSTAAVARASSSPGWTGVSAVETHPAHRRRGLARRLLAEAADEARERRARAAYLQVERSNAAALALYEGVGFEVHHDYHYRVAPAASPARAPARP